MIRAPHVVAPLRGFCRDERASQIVELALSLPLLVVFVVGIFDFSQAVSLKQKLTNAAREAARVAASDPATDVAGAESGLPVSISDANQVVDNYLISEQLNDCGLAGAAPTQTGGTLTWISTSTGTCPGNGITLTVNRGCATKFASGIYSINAIGTCVTLSYAYNWRYNSVIGVLGGSITTPTSLTAKAEAFNEN
jgi:Flp pilus assembly protein TadG